MMFGFSRSFVVTITPHAYPNLLNKGNDPPSNVIAKLFRLPLVFVDAGENLVMADDVAMPSNLPATPIEEEEFEEALLDVNVSQQSRKEKLFRKVVRTRIDRSVWDHQMFPNPRALAIYLEFVPTRAAAPKRF
jgi:hypothetical protein